MATTISKSQQRTERIECAVETSARRGLQCVCFRSRKCIVRRSHSNYTSRPTSIPFAKSADASVNCPRRLWILHFLFYIFDIWFVERDFTLSLKQRIDYYFLLRVNRSFEPRNTPGWQITCVSGLYFKMPLPSLWYITPYLKFWFLCRKYIII